jgi:hypothetical protein
MEEKTNLELQIMCQQNELSNRGGKPELIARLKKAGVTELKTEKPEVKSEKRARTKK